MFDLLILRGANLPDGRKASTSASPRARSRPRAQARR